MAKVKKTATKRRTGKKAKGSEEETFDVEKILDKRETSKSVQYYVKWKGYPNTENSWEPAENIFCNDLVEEYEALKSSESQTSKAGRQALVVKSTPIRGNLKFSPSPSPEVLPNNKGNDVEDEDVDVRSSPAKPSPTKRSRTIKQASKAAAKKTKAKTKVESPEKKLKTVGSDSTDLIDFNKFKCEKVIDESLHSKTITFKGSYDGESAVVVLEKIPFDEADAKTALLDLATSSTRDFVNDKYSSYKIMPFGSSAINTLKATVVCPATEAILTKYSRSDSIFFTETSDLYVKVVEPFINNKLSNQKDYNTWIYNILDGKSELDRVILNDPNPETGFVMAHSLKWSGDEKDLKILAICHKRDIRSLRDLDDEHLPLLKNILTKGTKAIKDKFKKNKSQLRAFIHYQPTFYHFHVHFDTVNLSDHYKASDRDNLLHTVINNITLNKDYYKKATLTYPLPVDGELYQDLKKSKRRFNIPI